MRHISKATFPLKFIGFVFLLTLLFACRQNAKPAWENDAQAKIGKAKTDQSATPKGAATVERKAPDYVYDVWHYVLQNGKAKPGYVGGRTFMNREKRLPQGSASGQKLKYQEWDVHPKINGVNRGAERLVTGSDRSAYYTKDHYRSFTRLDQ